MDYAAHTQQMLAHFLKWLPLYPEYIGKHAIPEYFRRCPWAEPLIGEQLREAWRKQGASASAAGAGNPLLPSEAARLPVAKDAP